ncbi:TIGR02452 family protein [Streptomyces sp. NPDC058701]|uniref:TIGR02452 family protein n=1 Tax=Streptomyces sp. NPDC058701 TaxID=3346608 RepID=UPI0036597C3D
MNGSSSPVVGRDITGAYPPPGYKFLCFQGLRCPGRGVSSRSRAIARENSEVLAAGGCRARSGRQVSLAAALAEATAATRIYGPNPVIPGELSPGGGGPTTFEATGESGTVAARRLAADGCRAASAAVLNFASARNPGGGYVRAAKAQEEAPCRASALYETLPEAPERYAAHRADRSTFSTDRVIHSPGVPVFRDDHVRTGRVRHPRPRPRAPRRLRPAFPA